MSASRAWAGLCAALAVFFAPAPPPPRVARKTPVHKHGCDDCRFLGGFKAGDYSIDEDLYYCTGQRRLVVRWADGERDFKSAALEAVADGELQWDGHNEAYVEALRRAHDQGYTLWFRRF